MKKDNRIDLKHNLILIYNRETRKWDDRSESITALYKAYYYGNFSGYNVYFRGASKGFFYVPKNIRVLKMLKEIDIKNQKYIVNDLLINPTKIESYQFNYYKIYENNRSYITNRLRSVNVETTNNFDYYVGLAKYAKFITNEDEPLRHLANTYEKIKLNTSSVLYDFFEKDITKNPATKLIVPFVFDLSQQEAIKKALEHNISIIEGPPGTGKTQTIINLIANILLKGQNVAVVSNNNTAVENVYEKLVDENLEFLVAHLGNRSNVESFFENLNDDKLNEFLESSPSSEIPKDIQRITTLNALVNKVKHSEIKLANLQTELNSVKLEQSYHDKKEIDYIGIKNNLKSHQYLNLVQRLEEPKRLGWLEKIRMRFKYKLKISEDKYLSVINELERLYYKNKVLEIEGEIKSINDFLNRSRPQNYALDEIRRLSKAVLLKELHNKYTKMDINNFNINSYRYDYQNFLNRYPVLLSTSHSILNNIAGNHMFDYIIIDEASQGDLLSSVLAMSVAKNIVVVGDTRQLQQIDETRLFDYSIKLAEKHNINKSYQYQDNSILSSIIASIPNVPRTLLKQHYRCAPDIINFCNKMFYDNELIPMTSNKGKHISIIKTVPGNHARRNPYGTGQYNDREIQEINNLLVDKDLKNVGVITPFRYQANLISDRHEGLEADTIHKFQGREKDEIILSFVVNSLDKSDVEIENRLYNFVTDEKLLNVAISRAKNNITAIVSDKVYNSKNNIIKDFILYTEYIYGDNVTKESKVTSVFDYLYEDYHKILKEKIYNRKGEHASEILMMELIDNLLINHKNIGYQMHVRLSRIIKDTSILKEKEKQYVNHPWTHVDFLFFNKVTKQPLFVLEVDGIRYHEQSYDQINKDQIKDKVINHNKLEVYRFKTNEANEKARLTNILKQYTY